MSTGCSDIPFKQLQVAHAGVVVVNQLQMKLNRLKTQLFDFIGATISWFSSLNPIQLTEIEWLS